MVQQKYHRLFGWEGKCRTKCQKHRDAYKEQVVKEYPAGAGMKKLPGRHRLNKMLIQCWARKGWEWVLCSP